MKIKQLIIWQIIKHDLNKGFKYKVWFDNDPNYQIYYFDDLVNLIEEEDNRTLKMYIYQTKGKYDKYAFFIPNNKLILLKIENEEDSLNDLLTSENINNEINRLESKNISIDNPFIKMKNDLKNLF